MKPAVYWRSALGLFWAFLFFMLLVLIVGMTFLGKSTFYPYAIFLSAILLLFLTAFLLFDKRIKAGFYMCLGLSFLFIANQVLTLYFLFIDPKELFSTPALQHLLGSEENFFPWVVSSLLLLWGVFLFLATLKSKPVFESEMQKEQLAWLVQLKKETLSPEQKEKML